MGRQAAAIAAASGLVLSIGLPAQAAPANRITADSVTPISVASHPISVPATASLSFARPAVSSTPAPAPVRTRHVAPAATRTVPVAEPAPAVAVDPAAAVAVPAADPAPAAPAPAAKAAPAPAAKVTPAPAAPAPISSSGHAGVAAAAYAGIGHPYVWGGTSPAGWDCSGFVQWAYAQAGISIPRTNQWSVMVQTGNPQPGDLVVQNGGVHVGIYVGNGMVISALNPSVGTLLLPATATGTSVFYTMR
ncbi:C40 family peptidase [Paenarthrobacter sp. Z7-10]|uniref:C40 family peptidase n=1 Tax=Paenarthrobacter sp. Z7-10 TaxID=2787635 RepID=UPI0022A91939|nr:C40 family peptidase [Paenarthrobacter sp. Z7-10]